MNNELYHHGILGQKWGIRRYQNSDGSLTNAGKLRYGKKHQRLMRVTNRYEQLKARAEFDKANNPLNQHIIAQTNLSRRIKNYQKRIDAGNKKWKELYDEVGLNNLYEANKYVNEHRNIITYVDEMMWNTFNMPNY